MAAPYGYNPYGNNPYAKPPADDDNDEQIPEPKSPSLIKTEKAQKLIIPTPPDNKPPTRIQLVNNKKGFEMLIEASQMQEGFMAHYYIAQYYMNGLMGGCDVDKVKAVYHLWESWQIQGNHTMTYSSKLDRLSETTLLKFNSLINKIKWKKDQNDNKYDDYIVDIDELFTYLNEIQDKAQVIPYKVLAYGIHGNILRLKGSTVQAADKYNKCIKSHKKGIKKRVKFSDDVNQIAKNAKLNIESMKKKCAACGTLGIGHKRCSNCKKRWYCNGVCQKSNWKKHKKVCKKLAMERKYFGS